VVYSKARSQRLHRANEEKHNTSHNTVRLANKNRARKPGT